MDCDLVVGGLYRVIESGDTFVCLEFLTVSQGMVVSRPAPPVWKVLRGDKITIMLLPVGSYEKLE